jgi:4-hydroxyisophthalate hydroxylase
MSLKSYDVIIAGGGPVGLAAALALGQRGVRCLVVERNEQPSPIPRGQNLTQRTLEHFHFWGIEKALRAARTIPAEYGMGGLTAYGTLLGDYHYDWMRRELVRPFYFTDNERLPQYATEAVLRHRVSELASVETAFGWSVEDLSQDADGVSLTIRQRSSGDVRHVTGSYAIGADGSRSLVRERAGITSTLRDHDKVMVLLVFRSPELHALLARYPGKSFFCVLDPKLDGYWKFLGRVDLGATFFFHAPVPADTTRDSLDAQALLESAIGAPFKAEIEHFGLWDLRIAIADRYANGRVFVAGDAAHSHPPYGGYGINTGFEDAVNLAWKLDASLKGWAGPQLLDSYSRERQPVFTSTAQDFIERSIEVDRAFLATHRPELDRPAFEQAWAERASGATGEVHAFEPNYEGSPVVFGPANGISSARGSHHHTARAGHHLSPVSLSDGRNVFDVLDGNFALLAFDAAPAQVTQFEAAAQRLGLPLRIIRDDASGNRHRLQATLVLVRPDQYVAWAATAETTDTAETILRRCIGA